MSKAIGVICILAGSVYLIIGQVRKKQQELSLQQSLITAMRAIESSIRWKGQVLPICIKEQESRKHCGIYFKKIAQLLESGFTLQSAWENAFQTLPEDTKAVLLQMEWEGDENHLLGNLQCMTQALTVVYGQQKEQQHSEEKLLVAAIGSATGLLIIILL